MTDPAVSVKNLYQNIPSYLEDLFASCTYPWEILPKIGEKIQKLLDNPPEGFKLLDEGILVGEDVKIHPSATLIAPLIIGKGCEIRPGAYLRGKVITGEKCVIGNSSELKNCVLLDRVQVPHYNYVGDSVLGYHAHLGAGAICSNLKSDGKNVVVHGAENYETSLRKVGAFLGDGADVGCHCVLNPGTVLGRNVSVYPLTSVRGVIPENTIVKSMQNLVIRRQEEE